jgi:hypothetical protein
VSNYRSDSFEWKSYHDSLDSIHTIEATLTTVSDYVTINRVGNNLVCAYYGRKFPDTNESIIMELPEAVATYKALKQVLTRSGDIDSE